MGWCGVSRRVMACGGAVRGAEACFLARPCITGQCWPGYAVRRCSVVACTLGAVDDIVRGNREKLAGLLWGREGWLHGIQDGEEYWYFGVDGEARLTIVAEADGFLLAIHDGVLGDARRGSWVVPRIESVGKWLDEREAEHAGLTPLGEEFKRAYEKALEERERGLRAAESGP